MNQTWGFAGGGKTPNEKVSLHRSAGGLFLPAKRARFEEKEKRKKRHNEERSYSIPRGG